MPGYCGLGDSELELHPTGGHTVDGMAVWAPWLGLLVCGDYLSPFEIPTVSAGVGAYLDTLTRLEPLVAAASRIVPGHGGVINRETAQRVLAEDRAYLEALGRDSGGVALPDGRRDGEQRRLHAENVARLA